MNPKTSLAKHKTDTSLDLKSFPSIKIPNIDVSFLKFDETFSSFSALQSPTKNFSFTNFGSSNILESKQLKRLKIKSTLESNKLRLSLITKKISEKRQEEFQNYMNRNIKYCKLLELNNDKSRILTSLKSNIGEVVIKAIQQHKPQDYQYVVESCIIDLSCWKPQSREGQLCMVYESNVYLFGGHNSNPIGDVCCLDFKKKLWSKIPNLELKRSYHTGVVYKQMYFIIFGGMSHYNSHYKTRQCLNTVCLFSPKAEGIKDIIIQNQRIVEPRRSHSACMIGRNMLIFGGINMFKEYLRDLKYLDLKDLKWVELDYQIQTPELEQFLSFGIAKHVMIPNFKKRERYVNKIYNKDYDQEEGIFIFGGANKLNVKSIVIQISFQRRTPRLKKLYPAGQPPSSISPIAEKINQNILAIVSGDRFQRQLKLYKIKQNQFIKISYISSELGGIGSSIISYQNEIYILFGLGNPGYLGSISSLKIQKKLKTLGNKTRRQRRSTIINRQLKSLSLVQEV